MRSIVFILLVLVTVPFSGYSQYWGPDTTQTIDTLSFDSAVNHVYGELESIVSTGYLSDRSPLQVEELMDFDGSSYDSLGNYFSFLALYSQMRNANMQGASGLDFLRLDSIINIQRTDSIPKVPIGFLLFDYNTIDSLAIDSNALCWSGYQILLCDSTFPTLFDTSSTFFAGALTSAEIDTQTYFILDSSYFFTNRNDTIDSIFISVDNGAFTQYSMNDSFLVQWTDSGQVEMRIRLKLSSGMAFKCRTYFRVSYPFEESEEFTTAPFRPKKSTAYCSSTSTVTIGDYRKNAIQPDKHYDMYAAEWITNPDNNGSVKAKIGEYYACGNSSGKIRKPFIIVTGFSPDWGILGQHLVPGANLTTTIANHNIYNNLNGIIKEPENNEPVGSNNQANILYALRNEGFDIVIVDFYNGVDYVENGASLVTKLIKSINVTKEQNGWMHENVVMGVSLGALMTRYALAKMEADHANNPSLNPHHHTRLSISHEGEMQGAHIPLAIQFGSHYITNVLSPTLAAALFTGGGVLGAASATYFIVKMKRLGDQTINCPTAYQLLVEHHKANNQIGNDNTLYKHSAHTAFFNALNTLGYPSIRNIAIANADQDGDGVSPSIAEEGDWMFNLNSGPLTGAVNGTVKGWIETAGATQTVFQAGVNYYGIRFLGAYRKIRKYYSKAPSLAAASTERFYDKNIFQLNRPTVTWLASQRLDNYDCSFVPITSVFDVQASTNKYYGYDAKTNLLWYEPGDNSEPWGYPHNSSNITQPQTVTPFDAVFAHDENDLHVNDPRWQIREFLIDEMADNSTYKYFLENRSIGVNEAYGAKFEARQELTLGKAESNEHVDGRFILGEFSETEITSETEIILKPGVDIFSGAKSTIKVENMCSQCFAFQSLSRVDNELNPNVVSQPYLPAEDGPNFIEEKLDPKNSDILIFPNPTLSSINIKNVLIGSKFEIKDAFGKNIMQGIIEETQHLIDLKGFKSGIYFIHMNDKLGESHIKRIVKL